MSFFAKAYRDFISPSEKEDVLKSNAESEQSNNSYIVGSPIYESDFNNNSPRINVWDERFHALYAHYAGVGLLLGITSATTRSACLHVYNGEQSFCQNANYFVYLPWSLKIIYAIFCDLFWPMGTRRKFYMIFGWVIILLLLLALGIGYTLLNANAFVGIMMAMQALLQIANVPADGLSVEYARNEKPDERGRVLITGQLCRFAASACTSLFRAFFLNGDELNDPNLPVRWDQKWNWGLTLRWYFIISSLPIIYILYKVCKMEEPSIRHVRRRSFMHLIRDIWDTLCSKTSLFVIIYVLLKRAMVDLGLLSSVRFQYELIGIPSLQFGIEGTLAYVYQTAGVLTFREMFINTNWKQFHLFVELVAIGFSFCWIFAFYNTFGLRNGWYSSFLEVTETYITSLNQVLGGVLVIEISKRGIESTTYELVISIANMGVTLSRILGHAIAEPFHLRDVPVDSFKSFDFAKGPSIFTSYTIVTLCISAVGAIISVLFLPKDRMTCAKWKMETSKENRQKFGIASLFLAGTCVSYGLIVSFFYLIPDLRCLEFVGGRGCVES